MITPLQRKRVMLSKKTSGTLRLQRSSDAISDFQEDFINYVEFEQYSEKDEDDEEKILQLPQLTSTSRDAASATAKATNGPKYTIVMEKKIMINKPNKNKLSRNDEFGKLLEHKGTGSRE